MVIIILLPVAKQKIQTVLCFWNHPQNKLFFLINLIPENSSDPENVIQSKYYDIDELQKLKIPNKENFVSLFHINSCSLNKNVEELQNLLQSTNTTFDVIAITETRIPKNVPVTQNIVLNNHSFEHTPTESSAGGTLLYIANRFSYKICNDLKIY